MVIEQGDIWWAELGEPIGSAPGYRRPVVVVQGNRWNASAIATVICVPTTTQLRWETTPGNVLLKARVTGLNRDSVAQAAGIVALDRSQLVEYISRISTSLLDRIFDSIDIVLDRKTAR